MLMSRYQWTDLENLIYAFQDNPNDFEWRTTYITQERHHHEGRIWI